MAYIPQPIVGQALAQGTATGGRLADLMFQGQQRRKLPRLAELAQAGNFEALGAEMIGAGMVPQGMNALNVPYNREQQQLANQLRQQQFHALQGHRAAQLGNQDRDFEANQWWRQAQLNKPKGPQSVVAKINADIAAGLITPEQGKRLLANATAPKSGIRIGPDGTVQIGGTYEKATEGQTKANIFSTRMEKSNEILDNFEDQGTDLWQKMATGAGVLGNYFKTPEFRKYEQAKRDFLNAVLRQESGAAIGKDEFANGEIQYFPQPGDDPQTIAQKRRNRITAMETIRQASGPFSVKPQQAAKPNFTNQKQINGKTYGQDANGDWYEVD